MAIACIQEAETNRATTHAPSHFAQLDLFSSSPTCLHIHNPPRCILLRLQRTQAGRLRTRHVRHELNVGEPFDTNIPIAVDGRRNHRRRTADPPLSLRFSIDDQQRCDQLDHRSQSAISTRNQSENICPPPSTIMSRYEADGDRATYLSFSEDL